MNILAKNENFDKKINFWQKMNILGENVKFWQSQYFEKRSNILQRLKIFVKKVTENFEMSFK